MVGTIARTNDHCPLVEFVVWRGDDLGLVYSRFIDLLHSRLNNSNEQVDSVLLTQKHGRF